jgi:type VI secretion system secreted protein Hcp
MSSTISASGRIDLFLKVTSARSGAVKGESLDDDHKDEIQLQSWSWGMKSKSGLAAGGAGRKSSVNELRVVKELDAASCALMAVLRNNDQIKECVLIARKAGKKPHEFLKITLEKARLTSFDIQQGDAGGAAQGALESWEFSFQSIEVEYVPQGEDGQPRGSMMFSTEVTEGVGG